MLKKGASKFILAIAILAIASTACFAEPVARVKDFPRGEGVAEFLDSEREKGEIEIAAPYDEGVEYHDTFIFVAPVSEKYTVELYTAEMDDQFDIVPKRDDMLANAPAGWALPFWCIVPEGMPYMVVMVTDDDGNEHLWYPFYSGEDGSFITDEKFIPFSKEEVD